MTPTAALEHDRTAARGDGSYDDTKRLAASPDPRVRAALAARTDLRPELLFFLACDTAPEVRREIASNAMTPMKANAFLAQDGDPEVRALLGRKVAQILPGLPTADQDRLGGQIAATLAALARDQVAQVRAALAEALQRVPNAPAEVVRALARDAELPVAEPVLRFSPLLDDSDLVELVGHHAGRAGALSVIAGRPGLGGAVADAIVANDNDAAVAALLANASAQIREETLDRVVTLAPGRPSWHGPLVDRPSLPPHLTGRLAGFVADALLQRLLGRPDLDAAARVAIAQSVRARLEAAPAAPEPSGATEATDDPEQAEARITEAVMKGDRAGVRAALAQCSGVPADVVERIFAARSPKGIVSLVWKAGLSPRLSLQIQVRVGGISPTQALRPKGNGWALCDDEMGWHLDFFGG